MKTLQKMMRKVKRGQGGFTLIELLVVVAILGVIAAVVVLNVGGFMGEGKEQSANTEAHQVQTSIIAYMAANNKTSVTAGTVTATGSTEAGIVDYMIDYGKLQATYAYSTSGAILVTGTAPITNSKWSGCTYSAAGWTCT